MSKVSFLWAYVSTETFVLLQKFLKVLEFFNQIKETYASLFLTM